MARRLAIAETELAASAEFAFVVVNDSLFLQPTNWTRSTCGTLVE